MELALIFIIFHSLIGLNKFIISHPLFPYFSPPHLVFIINIIITQNELYLKYFHLIIPT
jgi:hypothetical protein